MRKKALVAGGLFGLVAPLIGIYMGLQVSTLAGNVLAFPIIGVAYVTGQPFGMWSSALMLIAVALSIVAWALIFSIIARLIWRS